MAKASKEIIQKHEQMFYPTVRVRTKKAGGSGTVVYSQKNEKDGEIYRNVFKKNTFNQHDPGDNRFPETFCLRPLGRRKF